MSTAHINPKTTFDLQCLNCGAVTTVRYKGALLTCPHCGSVDLHVATVLAAAKKKGLAA